MKEDVKDTVNGVVDGAVRDEARLSHRPPHNALFMVIGLFFISFFVWAWFAEVDQAVRASGQVEPAGKVQKVQSRYQAVIREVRVAVGDRVEKGQVLIALDPRDAESSLLLAESKIALSEEELKIYQPLVAGGVEPRVRLVQIRQQLAEARRQKEQAGLWLQYGEIRAPVAGVVTAVHVAGADEVVDAGAVLAEIVPRDDYFLVRGKVRPEDISKVVVGQKARVSFTAYDFDRFGVLPATVVRIARNTTTTERGEVYYDAWVRTSASTFAKSGIAPEIVPGMIAQIDMLGDRQSVLHYLLSPLNRTASRALGDLQ